MVSIKNSTENKSKKSLIKKVITFIVFAFIGWLWIVSCLYFFQRNVMYFPDKHVLGDPIKTGIQNIRLVTLKTTDGLNLRSWYIPPKSQNYPTILFFHGNGGNLRGRAFKAKFFRDHGIGTLLVGYRGYGGNEGEPSEDGFYIDARAAMDFLLKEQKTLPKHIVIYGESIGTGVATQLATEYKAAALILESPFTSTVSVAKHAYPFAPVSLLLKDRYESDKKINNINMPLLIMHGTADRVVPYYEGTTLFNMFLGAKSSITIDGGRHFNLFGYDEIRIGIIDFLMKYNVLPQEK